MKIKRISKKLSVFILLITLCAAGLPAQKAQADENNNATSEELSVQAAAADELAAPVITGIKNTQSGVRITWSKVDGADYYRAYVKKADFAYYHFDWEKLGDTEALEILDPTSFGCDGFYYKVRAFRNDGSMSPASETSKKVYVQRKPRYAVANSKSGVKLEIVETPSGSVKGMIVYRKAPGESSFTRIAKTRGGYKNGGYIYYDTDVTEGETYSYKICTYVSGGWKSPVTKEKTIKYIGAPALKLKKTVSDDVVTAKLSWTEVPGATGYQIYYSIFGTPGSYIAKNSFETTDTSYVDTRPVDREAAYKVRAYFDDGTKRTYSAFSSAKGNAAYYDPDI